MKTFPFQCLYKCIEVPIFRFAACADGFTACASGFCIPDYTVCNNFHNCPDKSDEMGCGKKKTLNFNTLRSRQDGRHVADDVFKCIFWNENIRISPKISLKFVPKDRISNIPILVQIMAWRLPGGKPLSEPMMVKLPTHICVTRPQGVSYLSIFPLCNLTTLFITTSTTVRTNLMNWDVVRKWP